MMFKKVFTAVLALMLFAAPATAQISISLLPNASTLTGAELVPIVQGGVTVKTTISLIVAPILAANNTWSGTNAFGALTTGSILASGEITTPASTTGSAGFNLPHGAAPTSPVNGDLWTTSAGGLFGRINGVTHNYAPLDGATFTGEVVTPAATTSGAGLNLPPGTAPTSPVNGDFWTTSAGAFARINGSTISLGSTGGIAYTLVSTLTASSSATLTWSSGFSSYTDLKLVLNGTACASSTTTQLFFTDTNAATIGSVLSSGSSDASAVYGTLLIPSWGDHSIVVTGAMNSSARPTDVSGSSVVTNTSGTIATIYLKCGTGNIASGSASLYGR